MAKILTAAELIQAAEEAGVPDIAVHLATITKGLNGLAQSTARQLGVLAKTVTGLEQRDLMVTFVAVEQGQLCPEVLEALDPDGDWADIY